MAAAPFNRFSQDSKGVQLTFASGKIFSLQQIEESIFQFGPWQPQLYVVNA
jgi:hypothetical protein